MGGTPAKSYKEFTGTILHDSNPCMMP